MKLFCWLGVVTILFLGQIQVGLAAPADGAKPDFPKPLEEYHDEQISGIFGKLGHRIQSEAFNLVGTFIFVAAIIHTFLASKLMQIAHRLEHKFHSLEKAEQSSPANQDVSRVRDRLQFRAQIFHFLGEVEAVFGIWLVPLFLAILLMKGWQILVSYAAGTNAAEPIFVVVVMAMAGSRPVLFFCGELPRKSCESGGIHHSFLVASDPYGWSAARLVYY
jgi:hypothetical protein